MIEFFSEVLSDVFSTYYNYLFLIIVIFYNFIPKRIRPFALLSFSFLFFFVISKFLILYLITTILTIYISTLFIDKLEKEKKSKLENKEKEEKQIIKQKYKNKKRLVLIICILINVAFLFVFKYLRFFTLNANLLLNLFNCDFNFKLIKLIAPIGISFYTLQALSYLFDVYNGKIECDKNIFRVALFMSFFPQIVEGPMARYEDTARDLYAGERITYHNFCFGLQRIGWGLFKKIIIADRINILVKTVFDGYAMFSGPVIFIGALGYTIMLYMEFSAAMDVVIGIGEMFKVKIPENFRQPFFSKNISEFWTRWHITLGKWFKDYIYYPISLSKPLKKLTMKLRKVLGNYYGPLISGGIALFVVWLLNGLWHGAGWTFIAFGMYHFILIFTGNILKKPITDLCTKLKIDRQKLYFRICQSLKVSVLVVIGELIFRADNIRIAFQMLKKLFTDFSFQIGEMSKLGLDILDYLVLFIALIVVLIVGILREKNINIRQKIAEKNIIIRWIIYYILIFSIFIFGAYGPGYEPIDPIYADF